MSVISGHGHDRLTHIYRFNYGFEYLGNGKVICYQQNVSTQIARVQRTYTWYLLENKEVPDQYWRTSGT